MRGRHDALLTPLGLEVATSSVGSPALLAYFKAEARAREGGEVLGVVEGVAAGGMGILHIDSMRIFNSRVRGTEAAPSAFGVGLSLGLETALYGYESGCGRAELLAIKDDDEQHRRLVRYYKRLGCVPVCEVTGDDWARDVPHMLVWGGVGTRMDFDVQGVLAKWGLWHDGDGDGDGDGDEVR